MFIYVHENMTKMVNSVGHYLSFNFGGCVIIWALEYLNSVWHFCTWLISKSINTNSRFYFGQYTKSKQLYGLQTTTIISVNEFFSILISDKDI